MFEATSVRKILMPVLKPKNAEKYKCKKVISLPFPPNMKALIYCIAHYIVLRHKYCRVSYELAVSYTAKPIVLN